MKANSMPDYSQYERTLAMVLRDGVDRPDRTGTGTTSAFGTRMEFDMANGFPLITTKRVHFKSIVGELLWFLSGSTNALELESIYGVTIWREWMDESGNLGPVYGGQWRNWNGVGIDQITNVIEGIKADPYGRRHIVSAWNPEQLPEMALPPCHMMFQFYVESYDGEPSRLSMQMYQRSADMFLGVPYNIASYSLLLHMVAAQVDLEPGRFIWVGGDTHIYHNHDEQVRLQLSRESRPYPQLELRPAASIFDYAPEHVLIHGYDSHGAISAPVAV